MTNKNIGLRVSQLVDITGDLALGLEEFYDISREHFRDGEKTVNLEYVIQVMKTLAREAKKAHLKLKILRRDII
jgi:plasmid maintenance system antidote protein VapI